MKVWPWLLGGGLGWFLWTKRAESQNSSVPGVSTRPIFTWTFKSNDIDRVARMIRDHLPEVNRAAAGCLKNGRFLGWSSRPDGIMPGSFLVEVSFEYDGLLSATPEQIGRCLDKSL